MRELVSKFGWFWKVQRIGDVSQEIKRVRAQMEENEDLAILMRGLRGQNLRDSQFAEDNVELRLVEVYIYHFNSFLCFLFETEAF